jgi:hypothetical protein
VCLLVAGRVRPSLLRWFPLLAMAVLIKRSWGMAVRAIVAQEIEVRQTTERKTAVRRIAVRKTAVRETVVREASMRSVYEIAILLLLVQYRRALLVIEYVEAAHTLYGATFERGLLG